MGQYAFPFDTGSVLPAGKKWSCAASEVKIEGLGFVVVGVGDDVFFDG